MDARFSPIVENLPHELLLRHPCREGQGFEYLVGGFGDACAEIAHRDAHTHAAAFDLRRSASSARWCSSTTRAGMPLRFQLFTRWR